MILLNTFGRTFNFISLFAMILSIGLLVDNAIILTEGISEEIRKGQKNIQSAVIKAILKFKLPVITGTMTTIFAFFPMLVFITGANGDFISHLPFTVIVVLIASLIISLLLLPVVAVQLFTFFPLVPTSDKNSNNKDKNHRKSPSFPSLIKEKAKSYLRFICGEEDGFFKKKIIQVGKIYNIKMLSILRKKRNSWLILIFMTAAMIGSFFLPVGVEIFSSSEEDYFSIKIELPEGTALEETKKLIKPINDQLAILFLQQENRQKILANANAEIKEISNNFPGKMIDNIVFYAGKESSANNGRRSFKTKSSQENILGMTIFLVKEEDRTASFSEFVNISEKLITKVLPKNSILETLQTKKGPPSSSPIIIEIPLKKSDDLFSPDLNEVIDFTKEKLRSMTGVKDVTDSRLEYNLEYTYKLNPELLAWFGLTNQEIERTLRSSVYGTTLFQIFEEDEEIDVDLRVDFGGEQKWEEIKSLNLLDEISVKNRKGSSIKLSQLGDPTIIPKVSEIKHKDGEVIVTIYAEIEDGIVLSKISQEIEEFIPEINNTFPDFKIQSKGGNNDVNKLVSEMIKSMLIALILILIILILQFNSFRKSLIILSLIPYSLTAVFTGFFLINTPFGFPTMIGIVALAGIIVNDAIILVDHINYKLKESHKDNISSMIKACSERFQPIFLTSLTTIIGLIPLVFQDETWSGLGLAIIFGMTISTILTLILVPALLIVTKSVEIK
jgi:HAE1 family hydrophobic/amphiphilic exporter-1